MPIDDETEIPDLPAQPSVGAIDSSQEDELWKKFHPEGEHFGELKLGQEYIRGEEKIADIRSNRSMRETFAKRIYSVTRFWLAGVYIVILLNGFKPKISFTNGCPLSFPTVDLQAFYLSDTVMVSLLGATGAIGLLAIVLRNLFPNKDSKLKR